MIPGRRRQIAIVAIKATHSAIFLGLLASLLVFAQRGVAGRSDRLAAITGSVVAVEALVFLGNGRRCPLTDAVESLGATKGSVTDIFLPSFIASRIFTVTAPLFGLSLALHARNLLRRAIV